MSARVAALTGSAAGGYKGWPTGSWERVPGGSAIALYWTHRALLFVHLLGLGLYVGFHATMWLLDARIRATRDEAEELALTRMLFRILLLAVWGLLLLVASGLGLSVVTGYGFFETAWLTVKHLTFVLMILNTVNVLFVMRLLGFHLARTPSPPVPGIVRDLVKRRKKFGLINEICTLIIIVAAVWRF